MSTTKVIYNIIYYINRETLSIQTILDHSKVWMDIVSIDVVNNIIKNQNIVGFKELLVVLLYLDTSKEGLF